MSIKRFSVFFYALALVCAAGAQQITRVAVVDLERVIASYPGSGDAVAEYQKKKFQIQTEIDRLSAEIRGLQSQKLEADRSADRQASLRLEAEIYKKADFLREFVKTKQAELDNNWKELAHSNQFASELLRQIQSVAESEGYSLVINPRGADSVTSAVLWYSPMIDITEKVIQALMGKSGQ